MSKKRSRRSIQTRCTQLEQQGKVLTAAFLRTALTPESPDLAVAPLLERAVRKAKQMWKRAYAPFSHFPVGAAVIGESGKVWGGCNVECSSYSLTLCAERNALTTAVANGERSIVATVVYNQRGLTPPCGACRQMLYDFGPDSVVIVTDGRLQQWFVLENLLPVAFTAMLLRHSEEALQTKGEQHQRK